MAQADSVHSAVRVLITGAGTNLPQTRSGPRSLLAEGQPAIQDDFKTGPFGASRCALLPVDGGPSECGRSRNSKSSIRRHLQAAGRESGRMKAPRSAFGGKSGARPSRRTCPATSSSSSAWLPRS